MTTVNTLLREIELRQNKMNGTDNRKGIIHHGVIRMYNPEKQFGFVRLDSGEDIYFKLATARQAGMAESEIQLGLKVSVIRWQIHHHGPEVRTFITPPKNPQPSAKPVSQAKENLEQLKTFKMPSAPLKTRTAPPPSPEPKPAAEPIEILASARRETAQEELERIMRGPSSKTTAVELVDEWGMRTKRYPGGIEQLIINHLKEHPVTTREAITPHLIAAGYSPKSLQSGLSKVHARGWFIENGQKLYRRPGK